MKSFKWLYMKSFKSKGATVNPENKKDNKCFQYAPTLALNHQNIGKDLQRISKITPFINKYNWGGIGFPEGPKDWEKFEQNNKAIALNILYVPRNTEEICLCANQIIIMRVKIK